MNPQEKIIHRFYESFRARDAEGMCRCYHPEVVFSDPVFGRLSGAEATGMWRMLCARAKDLQIAFSAVAAEGDSGTAHWEAKYAFSKTGRAVHNVIDASFTFQDDRIVRHVDRFSLWRWSAMALGPSGALLGWSPLVRGAVRREARRGLEAFLRDQPAP
jgi:ketosteroid isomerase-like protein